MYIISYFATMNTSFQQMTVLLGEYFTQICHVKKVNCNKMDKRPASYTKFTFFGKHAYTVQLFVCVYFSFIFSLFSSLKYYLYNITKHLHQWLYPLSFFFLSLIVEIESLGRNRNGPDVSRHPQGITKSFLLRESFLHGKKVCVGG